MKSLSSNGVLSTGDWMGSDVELEYPGVDTCITVTCLVGKTLIGCHLYHFWRGGNSPERHAACLDTFAAAAKKLGPVKAVYIVGNTENWRSRLADLVAQLKAKLSYVGVIGTSNPSTCTGLIAVKLIPPVALAFTKDGVAVELAVLADPD